MSDAAPSSPLQHLEPLFAFAQGLTLDPAAAAVLVEQAYEDVRALPPERRPDDLHAWLYERVLARFRLQEAPAVPEEPTAADVRRRLAERLVDEKLPGALTLLPPQARALLLLCYAEGRSCTDAGRLLGLPSERACAELEAAQDSLESVLRASLTPVEQRLLDRGLPLDWPRAAFPKLPNYAFGPPPAGLRDRVVATMKRASTPAAPLQRRRRPRLRRTAIALSLIATAGLLGLLLTNQDRPETAEDLLQATVARAPAAEAELEPDSPEEAEQFVARAFSGRRLSVPRIEGAALVGVGVSEVAPGAEAPVLLYRDRLTDTPLTLHAYDYSFLDRNRGRLRLGLDTQRQIEEETRFDQYDLDDQRVLVWRHRDDIYVAVGAAEAPPLQDRIRYSD